MDTIEAYKMLLKSKHVNNTMKILNKLDKKQLTDIILMLMNDRKNMYIENILANIIESKMI